MIFILEINEKTHSTGMGTKRKKEEREKRKVKRSRRKGRGQVEMKDRLLMERFVMR